MPEPVFIDTRAGLDALLAEIEHDDVVALDTEFVREDTFFPQLCLIQLRVREQVSCIDALALEGLAPLSSLLARDGQVSVVHAARQDLEVLYQRTSSLPARLFDTQIAAALLGFDMQIAYHQLVEALLGVSLGKSHARTDWRQRPLSDAQLAYAADDVRYLKELYPLLAERLEHAGRLDWLYEEGDALLEPAHYRAVPELAWQRVKGLKNLDEDARRRAGELAAWRETLAIHRDRPRQWILKDPVLIALAVRNPTSRAALADVPGMPPAVARRHGERLLGLLQAAAASDISPGEARPPLSPDERVLVKRLRETLDAAARREQVSPGLLANRGDLERLARGDRCVPVLGGWRRTVAGEALLEALGR